MILTPSTEQRQPSIHVGLLKGYPATPQPTVVDPHFCHLCGHQFCCSSILGAHSLVNQEGPISKAAVNELLLEPEVVNFLCPEQKENTKRHESESCFVFLG